MLLITAEPLLRHGVVADVMGAMRALGHSDGRRDLRMPPFALIMVLSLASCGAFEQARSPSKSTSKSTRLPDAVLIDNGRGEKLPLSIKPVVAGGVVTGQFGERRGLMGGVIGHGHEGVDIAAPTGTPVRASAAGVIVEMGRRGDYGRLIRIHHARNVETTYAHLSSFASHLAVGRRVKAGEIIGHVGSSGRTTGPHLHFEVARSGKAINPLRLPSAPRHADAITTANASAAEQ